MTSSFESVKLKQFDCLILMNSLRHRSVMLKALRGTVRVLGFVAPVLFAGGGLVLSMTGYADLSAWLAPIVLLLMVALATQIALDCSNHTNRLGIMSWEFGRLAAGFGRLASDLDGRVPSSQTELQRLDALEQDFYALIRKVDELRVSSIYVDRPAFVPQPQFAC